jgi:phenylalanyl-tRNA synthetase beta chain
MTKISAVFGKDYNLKESDDLMYFPKRGAEIHLNGNKIGSIGILHPEVLENFHIRFPVTCFEISLEEVFDHFRKSQD